MALSFGRVIFFIYLYTMEQQIETPEFGIDTVVSVDRYNHIDDAEKGVIVGYDTTMGGEILYKIKVRELEIRTTGRCIVESKKYDPLPEKERNPKRSSYTREDRVARWVAYISSK